MQGYWQGLLASSGIIALFISIWSYSSFPSGCETLLKKTLFGVLFGAGAAVCMLFAFEVPPGVLIDLRNVLIALSGLFGGPISGLVTGALAAAFRLSFGGPAVNTAMVATTAYTAAGVIAHLLLRGRTPGRHHVLWLAAATAAISTFRSLLLPTLGVTSLEIAAVAASQFAATLLGGLAMIKESSREAISRSNLIYAAIAEALPDCLNVKDSAGRFMAANSATATLLRAPSREALIGRSDFDFFPHDVARRFRNEEREVMAARQPRTLEQLVTYADGTSSWQSALKVPVYDKSDRFQGLITLNRDISERKRLEEELARSQRHFSEALSTMTDGLVMYDKDERLVFCNERYLSLFPVTRDVRKPGARFIDIVRASYQRGEKAPIPGTDEADRVAADADALSCPNIRQFELADGRWLEARVNVSDGNALVTYSDVTALKHSQTLLEQANARLEQLARVDPLTDCLNRRAFDAYFADELSRAARGQAEMALLLVDVDKFKLFNDGFGHLAGDDCLRRIAQALKDSVRRSIDRVARYGGEEFVVILAGTGGEEARRLAEQVAESVRALNIPHPGSEHRRVTISIGMTVVPRGTKADPEAVLREADEALYRAKANGRNRVEVAGRQPPALALVRPGM